MLTAEISGPSLFGDRSDGTAQALVDLADLFLAESEQWIDDISAAIRLRDMEAALLSAQSLKFALAAFGLDQAVEKAAQIEQLARHRQWARLARSIRELSSLCVVARRAVRRSIMQTELGTASSNAGLNRMRAAAGAAS